MGRHLWGLIRPACTSQQQLKSCGIFQWVTTRIWILVSYVTKRGHGKIWREKKVFWKIQFIKQCPSGSNFNNHFIADVLQSCLNRINSMQKVLPVWRTTAKRWFVTLQGNSVKSDVHFGHFQGLDFYCQWGHLGFKVCMMCRGTSTIITLIIRLTPCFILEKCVKNTMVLDVRARNDFFRLSCSCSKLCDVWGLTLKLIPVLIAWSIGLYNIHKHYL